MDIDDRFGDATDDETTAPFVTLHDVRLTAKQIIDRCTRNRDARRFGDFISAPSSRQNSRQESRQARTSPYTSC